MIFCITLIKESFLRLILHIGSSKTGTTTIQQFFCRNHAALLTKGIFYPVRRLHTSHHILLTAGFVQLSKYQLSNKRFYMGNTCRYKRAFYSFWQCFLSDIQKHRPHTIVLSAETLFNDFSAISDKSLSQFLGQYFDDIRIVAYIRSPVPDYKSRLSHEIRTAIKVKSPHVRPIKSIIEYYENEFPGAIHVYPFERKQLKHGDVLCDFLANNIPDALELMRQDDKAQFKNVALPPALLQKLQKLRFEIQPEGRFPSISTDALIVWFTKKYERNSQFSLEQCNIELREKIKVFLQTSATDYKWLRERYGVTFSDLDYSKIEQKDNLYNNLFLLEDLCVLDDSADKKIEQITIPKNKLIRTLITIHFILLTQITGIYRAWISYSWLGKFKRDLCKQDKNDRKNTHTY